MKHISILILLLCSTVCYGTSAPLISWQKILGCQINQPNDFIVDNKGDYLYAGVFYDSCELTGHYDFWGDAWVLKTDSLGNKIWSYTIGTDSLDEIEKIIQTRDSGYMVVGKTQFKLTADTFRGKFDLFAIKLDKNGNEIWKRSFGSPGYDFPGDVKENANNELIIVGSNTMAGNDVSYNHGNGDGWVIKLDSSGHLMWEKSYGSSMNDFFNSVYIDNDGNYVIAGVAGAADGDIAMIHSASYHQDAWVLKIDDTGHILWSKTYGGTMNQTANIVTKCSSGGYLIGAITSSSDIDVTSNYGADDLWLINIDDTGKIIWQKNYGGSSSDLVFRSIFPCVEGGYIFTGVTTSNDYDAIGNHGLSDILIIRIDDTGSIIWKNVYGGSSGEACSNIYQNKDSSFVISCITNSHNDYMPENNGNSVTWLFKLGTKEGTNVINDEQQNNIQVYPSVTYDKIYINADKRDIKSIEVYDVSGKRVEPTMNVTSGLMELSLSNIPDNMYLVKITTATKTSIYKVVKQN